MWILHLLEEDEAYGTEDVNSSHNDGCDSYDGTATMECVCIFERAVEDCHLSNEAREARKTEVGQTSNDITYREERHDLHKTSELTNVASVGTSVNHTNQGKEEGCHKTV